MEQLTHENNVYAHDVTYAVKHISEVDSGRRGYYCMGCGREMQARKGERNAHHFAHDPKDVENKRKCSYSDETYRHKLAKEILQVIKQIRVPSLSKHPPSGSDTTPRLIRPAFTIEAARVEVELPFFENEAGEVTWGRGIDSPESNGRHILIIPDVAFFNAQGKPVLLVELVATHKVDREKLIKIWRLGIDTVQVSIPRESPTEIENAFYISSRTKWLYNNEQAQADYLQLSPGNDQGVSLLDEFERQLLRAEESYYCRAAQLRNLIRAIGKSVGSEQYRAAQAALVAEISRVAANTERAGAEVRAVQTEHIQAISAQFRPEQERLAGEAERLAVQEREFASEARNLEERYFGKRAELTDAYARYRPSCQAEIDRVTGNLAELGAAGGTLAEREAAIAAEAARMERDFNAEQERIASAAEAVNREQAGLSDQYRQLEEQTRRKFGYAEEQVRGEFTRREKRMRENFEGAGRESIEAVASSNIEGSSSIHRRIRDTLQAGGLLDDIEKEVAFIRRYRKAKAVLDSRAYKNWV